MKKTVYYIPGDGIGPEVYQAGRMVLEEAVSKAYGGTHSFDWQELLAGEKALKESGELLPQDTINTLQQAELAIKGPLTTPVGKGFRSLNVTLRQTLDLYACIRPIRHIKGVPSPVKNPEAVNMVVFRENTEDVYAGIEYAANSPEARRLAAFLREELGAKISDEMAIGIKPMSAKGSKRLIRRAINYALAQKRPSVTMMHKGNIMKFTEGGFRNWGYELAAEEFSGRVITAEAAKSSEQKPASNQVVLKDVIADALFQSALLWPEEFSVIAAPNLNGDYISDALAAQVGGLGIAPGVNMSDSLAFFEATHGTAPAIAGQDRANPLSFLLSGSLMLEHIGWHEAAQLIEQAVDKVVAAKTVTEDLARQMPGSTQVGCKKFAELLSEAL